MIGWASVALRLFQVKVGFWQGHMYLVPLVQQQNTRKPGPSALKCLTAPYAHLPAHELE